MAGYQIELFAGDFFWGVPTPAHTAQLFTLSNLWMERSKLLSGQA